MPEATGLDLLRRMQASEDPRPIILLTGHGDIEMAVQALKLGAYDFYRKAVRSRPAARRRCCFRDGDVGDIA